MKINIESPNPALISIIEDPEQIITLDANFLIPPDRSRITQRGIGFKQFSEIWLDPIFNAFPNLAIHEAVYDELVGIAPQNYVDAKRYSNPSEIIIHEDSSLPEVERILRDTIESKIASLTKYDPLLDNKDDRGEVKSLSYYRTAMRMLYKYQYYLTDRERSTNPSWGNFTSSMENLYASYLK